jgi:hypothetical protein
VSGYLDRREERRAHPPAIQMRDEIDELVEREVRATGATRESVFIALVQFDAQLSRSRTRTLAEKQRKTNLRSRAGRILLYFRHGFIGGKAPAEDMRLIGLIEAPPRSEARGQ